MKIMFRDVLKVLMWMLLIKLAGSAVDFEKAIQFGDLFVFVVLPLAASAILDFLFTYPSNEDDKE